MHCNKSLDDVVDVVVLLLTSVSFALFLVGLTDFGQVRIFRFVLGEAALGTGIVYSFQAARCNGGKLSFFGIAIWFLIAMINFAQAVGIVPL